MDDTQIDDFKQFIASTFRQHIAELATKNDMNTMYKALKSQINDLDLKLDTIAVTLNKDLNKHDKRIKKLEHAVF
jgi:hypothetical protein